MATETMRPPSSLASRQVEEMVEAWRRGERPIVEEILARYPELDDDATIRLIYEEYSLRQEAGLEVDAEEIVRRFPRYRDELALLLDCHRLLESAPARVEYPRIGEVLAGFRLIGELGRGAAGRVYLAAQPSLGDRPVVLKVTRRGRDEHLSLARLQHMNIVPLYSEHAIPARGLQALCMPYLGGTTLAQVLEAIEDRPASERTGAEIVEVLDRSSRRRESGSAVAGPFRRYLTRVSYVEAIVSIGAALADGLHHAHERDLVHMDVKPSNVLLADDGQPMLLDFHLARGPIDPDRPPPEWMGGTLEFMSPEHRRAMSAVRAGHPIRDSVDARADIYSLGMLLYVALGGPVPEPPEAATSPLHRCNPRVSLGLSDIVDKCLADDPRDRYPDASSLAVDLRRHLADLPLRGVPNRSWSERWRKWQRRHPSTFSRRGLAATVVVAAIAAPASMMAIVYRERRETASAALSRALDELERHRYAEARSTLRGGLAAIDGLPGLDGRRRELTWALDRVARAARVAELHELAESIQFRYGLSPPPADEAPALIRLGREAWDARRSLFEGIEANGDTRAVRRLRNDLRELGMLRADLLVRYAAPGNRNRAKQEADVLLSEVQSELGRSAAIEHDRRSYTDGGAGLPSEWVEPRTARDHYDLGRSYLRSSRPDLAAEEFRLGLKLRPQDFWLNFYDGLCAYRLGQFDRAAGAFRTCVALAPDSAECYYNRALALQSLGRLDEAIEDDDAALKHNPRLIDALLNRGILHFRKGRYDDALADLDRAIGLASSSGVRRVLRYNRALVHQARGNLDSAIVDARAAVELGHTEARDLLRRLEQRHRQ